MSCQCSPVCSGGDTDGLTRPMLRKRAYSGDEPVAVAMSPGLSFSARLRLEQVSAMDTVSVGGTTP